MAQTEQLAGQMGFLTDAAHLLARSAPETSAYLLSQRNAVLLSHDVIPSDSQKEHVCGGCGHIMIPGHGDFLKIHVEKAVLRRRSGSRITLGQQQQQPKQGRKERWAGPAKVYTCGMCHRYTKLGLSAPEPIRRRRKRPTVEVQGQAPMASKAGVDKTGQQASNITPGTMPSANASSKKRAKNRKAGLQALLSQKQNETANKSGLSLADFLSK
ncbi:hypothetical protein MCOR27_005761 [Pyricularia oryzae]|uniref:Rpr2-domain-containing protein n=5 Tax=Pyricularia TaxID=48558 RepID=A0ABQ8NVB3_PYRGI|nr:uncharacterized protein MGG_06710 [Pyricularia oryzae 70-15]ELQ33958.1 hypothetical protein OOU_Y34scaffold00836g11 [Pyricularia oryzae Y34]KAH8842429.1 hypothetical protein MCOR01_006337 [Pyricularia oryzae]KAI6302113.1 hypothetical protein MCOR33_002572 [Pyricularia grisea]EHA56808.1 hypothetical protein MGG_06710 [Pyricularia oryzae 70-15]KAH9435671.1 hypothetical protein MCOR02_004593 [Pyricularia oryzae]